MTILDELERLSKEASRGGWSCKEMAYNLFLVKNGEGTICDVATWSYGEQVARYTRAHAELIVLMRNNIDALIEVARAAQSIVNAHYIDATCKDCTGETNHVEQLLESLERLDKLEQVSNG